MLGVVTMLGSFRNCNCRNFYNAVSNAKCVRHFHVRCSIDRRYWSICLKLRQQLLKRTMLENLCVYVFRNTASLCLFVCDLKIKCWKKILNLFYDFCGHAFCHWDEKVLSWVSLFHTLPTWKLEHTYKHIIRSVMLMRALSRGDQGWVSHGLVVTFAVGDKFLENVLSKKLSII